MRIYTRVCFLLIIKMLLFVRCDEDKNIMGSNRFSDFVYPLKVGNQWKYQKDISTFNFRPEKGTEYKFSDTTYTSTVTNTILREEIILDSLQTYVLQSRTEDNNHKTTSGDNYYANLDSGLFLYAYRSYSEGTPKNLPNNQFYFKGKYFNHIQEITNYITLQTSQWKLLNDGLTYENPPLQCIKYPVQLGSQWIYRPTDKPFRIEKKVVRSEQIKVPAGEFDCIKIQWLFDMDDNNVWDNDIVFNDYICNEGLIKRSILYKDMIVTSIESPEGLGLVDNLVEMILTEVTIQ